MIKEKPAAEISSTKKLFQTTVLASGSKGNCTLVRTENTVILIDTGLSFTRICEAISRYSISPASIDAVIISHEHSDHIRGIGPISRRLKVPVYISEPTYYASCLMREKIPSDIIFFETGNFFSIKDLEVHPFPSSHDAVDACNFTITKKDSASQHQKNRDRKLAIATDLGFCSKLLVNKLKDTTTLILESNHDMTMLMQGRYPWHLKQRVKSINGHLSNEQAIGLLSQILHPDLDNIILAHLSEENNNPSIVRRIFNDYFFSVRCNTRLEISSQHFPTPLIDI